MLNKLLCILYNLFILFKKWKILDLLVATRFWTFINVQNVKAAADLCKKAKKRVVTIMLSFLFLGEIICEHNFFHFL